jgi:uncharacterized protein YaaR (DUF327 family)
MHRQLFLVWSSSKRAAIATALHVVIEVVGEKIVALVRAVVLVTRPALALLEKV